MALNSADRAQVDDGAEDTQGFPGGSVVKNPPANAGEAREAVSIPGSGRSPGGGNGNSLQYSCLGNPMDRGVWRATVHRVAKSWTQLSMHGEDTQGDAKTLHSGLRTYLFLLSPSQLQVSVDPLLNLICQPHSEDLILILPDYSNSSAGFVFFFLPRALKTDSHPYFLPLTIIPAEQASASAFRRNQTSDQLGTLW